MPRPAPIAGRPCVPLVLVLAAACSRTGAPADAPASGALAATTGVSRAAARGFRVVPLGPMTGDVEILAGHPDSAGPFVMRIRELAGTRVPVHAHDTDEHVTVVRGRWLFAAGERWDSTALREIPTGGYAFAPRGTSMFAYAPEEAVVQVHGIGPFHIHWRDGVVALDSAGAGGAFRRRLGDRVASPRGGGTIRAGYASGALVQYEVERADGSRFMALESELRDP